MGPAGGLAAGHRRGTNPGGQPQKSSPPALHAPLKGFCYVLKKSEIQTCSGRLPADARQAARIFGQGPAGCQDFRAGAGRLPGFSGRYQMLPTYFGSLPELSCQLPELITLLLGAVKICSGATVQG